jgi:protein-disulfide isomerase
MSEIMLSPVDERDHARGPVGAPLTLVEYADFQCPYCAEAEPAVREIERRFNGRLRFVFRPFPLASIHEHAEIAAEAAEAAGAQGRFWEMTEQLFAHSHALGESKLLGYAKAAGVADLDRFEHDLRDGRYQSEVEGALARAESSGVDGTPSFFINGQPFEEEPTVEALSAALEAAAQEP